MAALLCALLSILLHVGGLFLLPTMDKPSSAVSLSRSPQRRTLKMIRGTRPPNHIARQKEQEKEPTFAKTDPDQKQETPDRIDYIGNRDARAASAPDVPRADDRRDAPNMKGNNTEEKLNTVEQQRQDGALEHEKKMPRKTDALPTPPPPTSSLPLEQTTEDNAPAALEKAERTHRHPGHEPSQQKKHSPATNTAEQTEQRPPLCPHPKRMYRDPSLSDEQQPGFRTTERCSNSRGRFVIGRKPALNVAATPRGAYEAEIYRRIARMWYIACDERRGDIIPGSLTISLRINAMGQICNMELVRRHGAGMLQQSFTFAAIRKAALPPMPARVRQEMTGDKMELLFTFNFD